MGVCGLKLCGLKLLVEQVFFFVRRKLLSFGGKCMRPYATSARGLMLLVVCWSRGVCCAAEASELWQQGAR